MDTQQIRLDSLEDLLGVMAVGNRLCRELWMLGELLSGCNNLLPSPWRLGDPTRSDYLNLSIVFYFVSFCIVL
ncbi:hypothetical protein Bca52824_027843 [Brassica carinata]|uniref:Uncharacterized protein n=1 Tax=Brassica carinata TaxID=52824 RepID=A0A8X8ALY2_BRACI|nr:hypothetical protein Bca52824_027843 [Brassica carinata]